MDGSSGSSWLSSEENSDRDSKSLGGLDVLVGEIGERWSNFGCRAWSNESIGEQEVDPFYMLN